MDIGDLGYPVRARFGGQTTPVKSARLVFSEEFNGASGGRRANRWKKEDRFARKMDD